MIAERLEDIDNTLDSKALNEENYEEYYVFTKDGRGEDPTSMLVRKLRYQHGKDLKILFSGFKGCGKSTELLRLKRELEEEFVIQIFSVREKLDPNNFSISEIIIAMMEELCLFVNEHLKEVELDTTLLESLNDWAKTIYEEERKDKSHLTEASAGAGLSFSQLLKVFGKLNYDFKSGRKYSQITKLEERQTLSDLSQKCNALLNDIKSKLDKVNKKNIIFVIEDLEKIDLTTAENLFQNYSTQMTDLACSIIYTFPISLVYNSAYTVIIQDFDENCTLPMIKVHDKTGKDFPAGIDSIEEILDRRIKKDLLPKHLKREFIKYSGGCLRDLFRMVKLASNNALDNDREHIGEEDYTYGLNKLKSDYFNTISYNERTGLSGEEYLKILKDCYNSEDKKPLDVKGMMDLKHNMCILGYNTDNWFDVHPVVKLILKDKRMVE